MLIKAETRIGSGVQYNVLPTDRLVVEKNVSVISTDAEAIYLLNQIGPSTSSGAAQVAATPVAITVKGLVQGQYGIYSADDREQFSIQIAETGIVQASERAITLHGDYNQIVVVNDGTILGYDGVFSYSGSASQTKITNNGTIVAERFGIILDFVAKHTVINTGRITGLDVGIETYLLADVVKNSGVVIGNINLLGGNDFFDGRGGRVVGTIFGGDGSDRFIVGNARDTINGDAGIDTLDFRKLGAVKVALDGSFANTGAAKGDSYVNIERLFGSEQGSDVLRGDAESNSLAGFGGADRLSGAAGQDIVSGGLGRDVLSGGANTDAFIYQKPGEGGDRITDFNGGGGQAELDKDVLYISAQGFGLKTPGKSGFNPEWLHIGRSNQAAEANDRFILRTTDTTLWFDADGKGGKGPILLADLQAGAELNAFNFSLI